MCVTLFFTSPAFFAKFDFFLDHIITPCAQCTQSVAKHQRAANGHRFVFHYQEIKAKERKYIAGEPGVNPNALPRKSSSRLDKHGGMDGDDPTPRLQQGDTVYWSMLATYVLPILTLCCCSNKLTHAYGDRGGERSEAVDPGRRKFPVPPAVGR
jgi:hypothetical protein